MKLLIILLSLGMFFSCSKIKELEDRTENMEDKMDSMEKTTNHMDKKTGELHEESRQGFSSSMRNEEFRNLRDPNIGIGGKIAASKKLFYAFEYQLWTGEDKDTEEERNVLFKAAFDELYQNLSDFHSGYDIDRSTLLVEDANTDTQAFYAISATMHFNNDKQEKRVHTTNKEELSIYDIIKTALDKFTQGKALTDYEELITRGDNLVITRDLLNARTRMLTVLAVKDMVAKPNVPGVVKKWFGSALLSVGDFFNVEMFDEKFEAQTPHTQKEILRRLDGALKAKNIVLAQGMETFSDEYLEKALTNIEKPVLEKGQIETSQTIEYYSLLDQIFNN